MGGNNSTQLANIFGFLLEHLALKHFTKDQIFFYGRYIDDIFLVDSKETAEWLCKFLNRLDGNIKYSMEGNAMLCNFLDLSIEAVPHPPWRHLF